MKRFHVHVAVNNLSESIRFYTAMFATEPSVSQADYAKWMLDDPRINFAISQRGAKAGLDHFGMQVESDGELDELNQRLSKAALPVEAQKEAACCYAQSNKYWTVDPQGLPWEAFHSLTTIPMFGEDTPVPVKSTSVCCEPQQAIGQKVFNVLFLCTGNSARSIMAEGLLNKYSGGRFRAFSAGSHPTGAVNLYALERLQLEGIALNDARSKSWDEFAQPGAPELDFVITVCDNAANEVCPVWPGQPATAHWGVFDPAAVDDAEKHIAFAKAFAVLERRISLFTSLRSESLAPLVLEKQVRDIGQLGTV